MRMRLVKFEMLVLCKSCLNSSDVHNLPIFHPPSTYLANSGDGLLPNTYSPRVKSAVSFFQTEKNMTTIILKEPNYRISNNAYMNNTFKGQDKALMILLARIEISQDLVKTFVGCNNEILTKSNRYQFVVTSDTRSFQST